jgi:hypothetical protein
MVYEAFIRANVPFQYVIKFGIVNIMPISVVFRIISSNIHAIFA